MISISRARRMSRVLLGEFLQAATVTSISFHLPRVGVTSNEGSPTQERVWRDSLSIQQLY